MKYRDAVILYENTESDTKVETQELNFKDPLSALEIEVSCTNGATSNKGNFISDIVTRVEVVDGSDVLASLNMSQLEALHFYKTGKTPALFPSEKPSGVQRHNALLMFGRYLWDKEYALDPSQYNNPQVKLTMNKAAIRAAGATGFASGDNIKLTLVAKLMEDQRAPGQYLMDKQIDSFTSAASGDKRIDLPRDYPYRMLMMRAYQQGKDIYETISDLKLTCDTDKYVILNRKVQQLDAQALYRFGRSVLKHDIFCSDNEAVRLLHNMEPDCRIFDVHATTPDILGIIYQRSSEMKPTVNTHAGEQDTTDRDITMVEEGHALHATLPIPFGLMEDPDTWFDPRSYSKFEAVLTQAAASSAVEIVAEQVRSSV